MMKHERCVIEELGKSKEIKFNHVRIIIITIIDVASLLALLDFLDV